ncbi:hypothetical protein QML28_29765, partial [Klebsiella pneumoniae]|uniref:hypothetical protein n=1 Tax=Klebsiella pneumoniae TaxID=573 RepID=UPI003A7FC1DF
RNRFYIWKKYSPGVGLAVKIKFWLDIAYVSLYDIGSFIVRPWRPWYLIHALGVAWGSVECLAMPPTHKESPANREYTFDLSELST